MKRTEKSKANSRQESKANSRQKSKANGRQSKPKDYDRDDAKYEEKHSKVQYRGKLQPASPEASKNRCRCPTGAGRSDHCSEAATQKVQKIVMDSLRSEIGNIVMDSFSLKAEDR